MRIIKSVSYFVFMLVLLLTVSFCVSAEDEILSEVTEETTFGDQSVENTLSGFVLQGENLYYYLPETGEKFIPQKPGVYVFEEKAYLFGQSGEVKIYNPQIFTVKSEGFTYCITKDNSLASGFQIYNGKTYYFDEKTYEMKTGWVQFKEGKRYFSSKGVMYTGFKEISEKHYFFNDKGLLTKGWVKFEKGKRYFGKDGVMYEGFKKISEKHYYFNSKGYMKTGWVRFEDEKRYFGNNGAMYVGLKKISGKSYYFNSKGYMKTGWLKLDDGKRYFGTDGAMYTGLKDIAKKKYYFNKKGIMQTGWKTFDEGKRRFHLKKGYMLKGKVTVEGKKYFFDENGIVQKGFVKIGTKTYYFSQNTGEMFTGWLELGQEHYYFYENGKMAVNSIIGKDYVLSDGKRAKSKAVKSAVKVINSVSEEGMTKEQKLTACYNYIVSNFSYQRDYTIPQNLGYNWTGDYAQYAFSNKKGNCYKYASAMAYCAKVLGYKSRVALGTIVTNKVASRHGWTEVDIDGTTYIFDTVQEDYSRGNFYKRTYNNYPKAIAKSSSVEIVLY